LKKRQSEQARRTDISLCGLFVATQAAAVPQEAVTALDRYGHADEFAALVAFVAGPESSYINGANLTVDGGINA